MEKYALCHKCMPNVVYKDGFEFKKKAGNKMTDKEIIIDGVDVSKCSRLIVNQLYGYTCNCEEDMHLISSCKNRPNCYFKQLKRKEQECKKYENALSEIKGLAQSMLDDFEEDSID